MYYGDFNYRSVDWINTTGNHKSDNFINIIQHNFLKQIVSEPTREDSMLDLIITNSQLDQQYVNRWKIRQQ